MMAVAPTGPPASTEAADGGHDDVLDGEQHRKRAGRDAVEIEGVDAAGQAGEGGRQGEDGEPVAADLYAASDT